LHRDPNQLFAINQFGTISGDRYCICIKLYFKKLLHFSENSSNDESLSPIQIDETSFCVDDLIARHVMQIKMEKMRQTRLIYLLTIISTSIAFCLIAIAQCNSRRLYRFAKRHLPDREMSTFVRYYEQWKMPRQQLRIDYTRCIGSGNWSNVYFG
jgi:hypothetical protein